MSYPVWVNGSAEGRLDPADRGLAYGDGLFETLRIHRGRALLEDAHFSRLFTSADALGIPLSSLPLREDFSRFLAACPPACVAKIIVTRGSSGRGYLPDPAALPTVILSAHPLPVVPAQGMTVAFAGLQLASQPALAGHKHLNRLEQILLRRELASLAADEALVCSREGHVVEGVSANVFLVRDGRLCTPLLDVAGIRGVMRQAVLAHAADIGLPVEEGHYTPDDFRQADEVFFCNSVIGIRPVSRLQERHWGLGPVTARLLDFWQSLLDF